MLKPVKYLYQVELTYAAIDFGAKQQRVSHLLKSRAKVNQCNELGLFWAFAASARNLIRIVHKDENLTRLGLLPPKRAETSTLTGKV